MKKSTQQLVLLAAVTAGIVLLLTGSSTRPTESYTEHLPPGAKHAQHEILGEHHVNLWDPRKCVVIGLAVGYGMEEMELFIGSLRATGYPGKIIIGVASDVPVEVKDYLEEQRVETKVVKFGPCTFQNYTKKDGTLAEKYNKKQKCDIDHPDYKIQWGRFNLAAKWLQECADCTDGVMFTDVRDAFFQRDPFAAVQHPHDLMVFEEHQDVSTEHWLVDFPVTACKGRGVGKQPMLCSGSTMGSRGGMLTYFAAMDAEFRAWISDPKCRFDLVGDDQSIHNYLFYTGKLPEAVAIKHRTGPIHVVGIQADQVYHEHVSKFKAQGKDQGFANRNRYYGKDGDTRQWLDPKYRLTDDEGYILQLDGTRSPQVHQFDRFGPPFKTSWLFNKINKHWADAVRDAE
eukprot:m.874652 g.874652  ORF g.874652 m.874652 type:complete len:400 (-) comp23576_c0_seq18:306-1505(-)